MVHCCGSWALAADLQRVLPNSYLKTRKRTEKDWSAVSTSYAQLNRPTAVSNAFLVTLGYGETEAPTLAQVVFLSDNASEDTKTVAEAVLRHANNTPPQVPRFDWSTLRVKGTQTLNEQETAKLVSACSKGQVGVGRVSKLQLSEDWTIQGHWQQPANRWSHPRSWARPYGWVCCIPVYT